MRVCIYDTKYNNTTPLKYDLNDKRVENESKTDIRYSNFLAQETYVRVQMHTCCGICTFIMCVHTRVTCNKKINSIGLQYCMITFTNAAACYNVSR